MRLKLFEEFVSEHEKLLGGKADNLSLEDIAKKHKVDIDQIKDQIQKGIKVEKEHTDDESLAREIAKDHLTEDPFYYDKLEKMERKMPT